MSNHVELIRRRAGLTQQQLADLSGVAQPNIAAYERGARSPSAAMLDRLSRAATPRPSAALAEHRAEIVAAVTRHRGTAVQVFGSVARGEDRPGSDLDLLVTFAPGASLYDQVELGCELEELVGVRVDVVSRGGLRAHHAAILAEARDLD